MFSNPCLSKDNWATLYNKTSYSEEALYRLVEINTILGLKDEAMKYFSVLEYNHSGGEWIYNARNLLKQY